MHWILPAAVSASLIAGTVSLFSLFFTLRSARQSRQLTEVLATTGNELTANLAQLSRDLTTELASQTIRHQSTWESLRLLRAERARAAADFLAAASEHWEALQSRDKLAERWGFGHSQLDAADRKVTERRERMWAAQVHVQVSGSSGLVAAMNEVVALQKRYHVAYIGDYAPDATPRQAATERPTIAQRSAAIKEVVSTARSDLMLEPLDPSVHASLRRGPSGSQPLAASAILDPGSDWTDTATVS